MCIPDTNIPPTPIDPVKTGNLQGKNAQNPIKQSTLKTVAASLKPLSLDLPEIFTLPSPENLQGKNLKYSTGQTAEVPQIVDATQFFEKKQEERNDQLPKIFELPLLEQKETTTILQRKEIKNLTDNKTPLLQKISDISIKNLAIQALSLALCSFIFLVSNTLLLPITLPVRIYCKLQRKSLQSALAKSRLLALCQVVKELPKNTADSSKFQDWKQSEFEGDISPLQKALTSSQKDFCKKMYQLKTLIITPPLEVESYQSYVEGKIKPLISELAVHPVYQELKKQGSPPSSIRFLQDLAVSLYTQADGEKAYINYGKAQTKTLTFNKETPCQNIHAALTHTFSSWNLRKDNILTSIFWFVMHPRKMYHSLGGHTFHANDYNSCQAGNGYNNIFIPYGEKKVILTLGPGVTGDNIYQLYLDSLPKDSTTVRHDLQSPLVKGEDTRVQKLQQMQKQNFSKLDLYRTDFDSKEWKMEKGAELFEALTDLTTKSLTSFFEKFKELLKDENKYFFSENTLSLPERKNIVDISKDFFIDLFTSKEDKTLTPEERKKYGQMMQFVTQNFFTIAILLKKLQTTDEFCFGQACKQDIDRGMTHNIFTMIAFSILNNQKITTEDIYLMTGIANRALLVDHRMAMRKRYMPLLHFLEEISASTDSLKSHLQKIETSF